MTRVRLSHALVVVASIACTHARAHADSPAPVSSSGPSPAAPASPRERLAGAFTFVGGDREIAAKDAAIEKATDSMFFAVRGIARSRLRDATTVRPSYRFVFADAKISVLTPGQAPAVSPENGSSVPYKSSNGTTSQLSQRITPDGKLAQAFVAEDGQKSVVFALSVDGQTLSASYTVSSKKLPQDVHYTLTYRRN